MYRNWYMQVIARRNAKEEEKQRSLKIDCSIAGFPGKAEFSRVEVRRGSCGDQGANMRAAWGLEKNRSPLICYDTNEER